MLVKINCNVDASHVVGGSTKSYLLLFPFVLAVASSVKDIPCCSSNSRSCCVTFAETALSTWELSNGGTKTTLVGASASRKGAQSYAVLIGGGVWAQGGSSTAIEVEAKSFPDSFPSLRDKLSIPGLPSSYPYIKKPTIYEDKASVVPSTNATFKVTKTALPGCYKCVTNLALSYSLSLGPQPTWAAEITLSLSAGEQHIAETVQFRRLRKATASFGDNVRVRKVFKSPQIPPPLQLSNWRTMNYFGWPVQANASFVVQTLGKEWTPQTGGGAPVDMLNWSGNKVNIGASHTVAHQAPPNIDNQSPLLGFVSIDDVPVGEAYTLSHNVHMRAGYLFDREFLQYLWAIEPPQRLTPRYSLRHTVDKMLFALQYTPGPDGAEGGGFVKYRNNKTGHQFGFVAQAW